MKIYVLYLYENHRWSENENFVFFFYGWKQERIIQYDIVLLKLQQYLFLKMI